MLTEENLQGAITGTFTDGGVQQIWSITSDNWE